jgi:hypothetical protein
MVSETFRPRDMPVRACALRLFAALAIAASGTAAAAQIYVDNIEACNGLAPCYRTITEAVTAAAPNDVIEVFPGVYAETVEIFTGKDGLVLEAQARARPPVVTGPLRIIASENVQVSNLILESGATVNGGRTSGLVLERNIFTHGGILFNAALRGTARNNTFLAGGIQVGRDTSYMLIEGNTVHGGSITLASEDIGFNVIRRNVVRGGGIDLTARGLRSNLVEGNYVSGGAGIHVFARGCCSGNTVQRNISVDSDGCDINETQADYGIVTAWRNNRFITKCGTATD